MHPCWCGNVERLERLRFFNRQTFILSRDDTQSMRNMKAALIAESLMHFLITNETASMFRIRHQIVHFSSCFMKNTNS